MQLYTKIVIGMVAGAVTGLVANIGDIGWLKSALTSSEVLGTVFIRAITMTVIPLVVGSLLVGTNSLGDVRKLRGISLRTMGYLLSVTLLAICLGMALTMIVKPGGSIDPATRDSLAAQYADQAASSVQNAAKAPSVVDTLLNMIPQNPVSAAANFDLLALIVFTAIFGAALSTLPKEKAAPVIAFFDGLNEAALVIIGWVMRIAPYAVFTLIAGVVARSGIDLLRSLAMFALVVAVALIIHIYGTLGLTVKLLAKMSPIDFFRRTREVQLVAFSTSSSNATLPVSLKTAETRLGISSSIASFVLPLGATANKDGTALHQAAAVIFICQIYGVSLGWPELLTIILTTVLASLGTAGIPAAGIITIIIVLQSIGMGSHVAAGVSLILGVDRILDMMRTTSNVMSDMACCAYVARVEGEMQLPPE
mgnify:CR=1 FL=1|jgi:proton glutamate symport protein